ncbi:MAG TPA: MOSC domain-containing protein [Candidatus Desulfovibrio intestinipullorum]|uniref:MOSC domain-containing protein n=1 Tax=Candidatus Desulfovibrio intestinipullorum TaxID=2838536 RepID=A0A9D1TP81_9BACT|nr:MOSC domain-containing protein [Candidatus Desulfovibrio intestinipullorum]
MRVVAVNTSEKKGMRKVSRPEVELKTNFGVVGDSHADGTHRQLSLLGIEDINYMRSLGADVHPGDFAENITTEGVELSTYPIGTRFRIGTDVLLELTQIGKECHSGCEIRKLVGTCIMPKKGVFCRILQGGVVRPDDSFAVVEEDGARS